MNKPRAIKSSMILLCIGIILLASAEPIAGQAEEHSANFCLPAQATVHHEHKTQVNTTTSAFDREMMESIKKMDRDMLAAHMTGNPDSDFAAMMIPHHQGAIDMAKAFLLYGKDPVLLRLAKNITVTQQQEIEIMRLRQIALQNMTQMNTAPAFDREMTESMKKMDRDMMAAPMTGNPDSDFAAMMIPHHQGAIDMAKAFLLYGKDPVLLRLAKNITVTQQQEIETMHREVASYQRNQCVRPEP